MPAETHSHGGPLDPLDIRGLVVDRLAELLGCDPDDIRLEARLRDDLDVDDLLVLDLVEAIEDEVGERTVGFRVDDDDLGEFETVADLVDYVVHALGAHGSGR